MCSTRERSTQSIATEIFDLNYTENVEAAIAALG